MQSLTKALETLTIGNSNPIPGRHQLLGLACCDLNPDFENLLGEGYVAARSVFICLVQLESHLVDLSDERYSHSELGH